MKIIKRNGSEVAFDEEKIVDAIEGANDELEESKRMTDMQIGYVAGNVKGRCEELGYSPSVEEIQEMVENELMALGAFDVARNYITYRYVHEGLRDGNTTDAKILGILEGTNAEANKENANKNPMLLSTQRDYMAGETSRDLLRRVLLPKDVVEAHDEGFIHFHDMDYYAQHMHNCDLLNIEDMLQNGTVISNTLIERPKSFSVACTIITQISQSVSSCQAGGQSISLTHLAPFVDVSRQKIREEVIAEFDANGIDATEQKIDAITERRVRKEVHDGVQTIQYQVVTLMSTNGQAPFITLFMYLNEAKNDREREDLAMIIEEVLKQRIEGIKNEVGVSITPAFPKLIYVLDENNIYEDSPYYYLTKLAAKCTAKRMVPDYISAKMMKELKLSKGEEPGHGDVYTCMGCVAGDETVTYRSDGVEYHESIGRMWDKMAMKFPIQIQPGRKHDVYIDLENIDIYDNVDGWTNCRRIIKNADSKMLRVKFNNGRGLDCTPDHPFETVNRGVVHAEDLSPDDVIIVDKESSFSSSQQAFDEDYAWLLGVLLCDGCYDKHLTLSIAAEGEDEIKEKYVSLIKRFYDLDVEAKLQKRERKGTYVDLIATSDGKEQIQHVANILIGMFGGVKKADRQMPATAMSWNDEARMSLLAGMIDADGYVNDTSTLPFVNIGSTNKELALQQMQLAQSLGMKASLYYNCYRGKGRADTIRYAVSFVPVADLISKIACSKKRAKFKDVERKNHSISETQYASPVSIEELAWTEDSFDVTTESEHFTVSGIYSHNCRSFLTPDRSGNGFDNVARAKNYEPDKPKYYGRFNIGVVTLSLPDIALSSGGDFDKFWEIMEERTELCHKALRCRIEHLKGTKSDVAPILWQYGALARLNKGETIDPLLYNGYATASLGYAGLYECVKYMTGKSHTDPDARDFALSVMQKLNDKCFEWKAAENIDYSVYGTPLESTTYKFAKSLQRRFGVIKGVTDKPYVTNSYHVHVTEEIDAYSKLKFESEFQKLSPGGAISYVEVPDMQDNLEAVLSVMKFIYDNIMYAELNTKSDYCQVCGFDGEIKIVEDDGDNVWECPQCGNRDFDKMNVARRVCGYIGTNAVNYGRSSEYRDRVLHL